MDGEAALKPGDVLLDDFWKKVDSIKKLMVGNCNREEHSIVDVLVDHVNRILGKHLRLVKSRRGIAFSMISSTVESKMLNAAILEIKLLLQQFRVFSGHRKLNEFVEMFDAAIGEPFQLQLSASSSATECAVPSASPVDIIGLENDTVAVISSNTSAYYTQPELFSSPPVVFVAGRSRDVGETSKGNLLWSSSFSSSIRNDYNAISGGISKVIVTNRSQPRKLKTKVFRNPPLSKFPASKKAKLTDGGADLLVIAADTARIKCKKYLALLLKMTARRNDKSAQNVKELVQGLVDGVVTAEDFSERLGKEINSQTEHCLAPFLKKSLPALRQALATKEFTIDGIKPPTLS